MNRLYAIRKAYEENYQKMQEIIQQMGGDKAIKIHRRHQSTLYRKLRELQKREHYLDQLENRLARTEQLAS